MCESRNSQGVIVLEASASYYLYGTGHFERGPIIVHFVPRCKRIRSQASQSAAVTILHGWPENAALVSKRNLHLTHTHTIPLSLLGYYCLAPRIQTSVVPTYTRVCHATRGTTPVPRDCSVYPTPRQVSPVHCHGASVVRHLSTVMKEEAKQTNNRMFRHANKHSS